MEQGLKHIMLYVKKHVAALAMCYNPALVHAKLLGVPVSVKLVYTHQRAGHVMAILQVWDQYTCF